MFGRNVDVGPANRPLDDRPIAFQRVCMPVAAHVLFQSVVHALVVIAVHPEPLVAVQLVRRDFCRTIHVLDDVGFQRAAGNVRHDAGDDVAVASDHAEHDRFVSRLTAFAATAVLAADQGFIDFDVTANGRIAVNPREVLADFVAHAPSGLVVHRQLPLQFFRRNAVARRREQVHGIEPLLQRRVRLVERRSDHRVEVLAA